MPRMSTRFTAGLLLGTVAGGLLAFVPALRVGMTAWIVLWGGMALLAAPLAGALRSLGLRSRALAIVACAAAFAAPALMIFARLLKANTNHRPLGAATFAIVGALVVLGTLALSGRLVAWATTRARRLIVNGVAALSVLFALRLALPLLSAGMSLAVLDGVLLLAAALTGALAPVPAALEKRLLTVGSSIFAIAIALAVVGTGALPSARGQAQSAPVAYGVIGVFSR
jgi:hypothetical protein